MKTDSGFFTFGNEGTCQFGYNLFVGFYHFVKKEHHKLAHMNYTGLFRDIQKARWVNDSLCSVMTHNDLYVANLNNGSFTTINHSNQTVNDFDVLDSLLIFSSSNGLYTSNVDHSFSMDTVRDGFCHQITVDVENQRFHSISNFVLLKFDANGTLIDSLPLINTSVFIGGPDAMVYANHTHYLFDDGQMVTLDSNLKSTIPSYQTAYSNQSSILNSIFVKNNSLVLFGYKDFQLNPEWPKTSILNILPLSSSTGFSNTAEVSNAQIDTLWVDTLNSGDVDLHFRLGYDVSNDATSNTLHKFTVHVFHGSSFCFDPQVSHHETDVNLLAGTTKSFLSPWLMLRGFSLSDSLDWKSLRLRLRLTALNNEDFDQTNRLHTITSSYNIGMYEDLLTNTASFPNPFKDHIAVQAPVGAEISVYNTLGQLVFSSIQNQEVSTLYFADSLDRGVYVLTISYRGQINSKKLLRY